MKEDEMQSPAPAVVLLSALLSFGLAPVVSCKRAENPAPPPSSATQESPLPASLDALFPPSAPQPIFLQKMIALTTAMSGILADVFENDVPNAVESLPSFKAMYLDVSQLVPEWRTMFPLEPFDAFESALKNLGRDKDPGKVMEASGNLGRVCTDCHARYMVKVQQKFHWRDFAEIAVKDPMSGQQVDFVRLMQTLGVAFTGPLTDMRQGQPENAQKQFQGFLAEFQALTETCEQCHGRDERKYFVDAEAQGLIKAYGQAIRTRPPDMNKAEAAMMDVGNEICFKCHLVHVPAALSKHK
jgi:hypothetical protein